MSLNKNTQNDKHPSLNLEDAYFEDDDEQQDEQQQDEQQPTYSNIYYIENFTQNNTYFKLDAKDCVKSIAKMLETGFCEKFDTEFNDLYVKPYFDFDYEKVEKNEITKLVTSLNKISEHYGSFIIVGYYKNQYDPDTNDPVLNLETLCNELAKLGYEAYEDKENNKIKIFKYDRNRIILYETPEEVHKSLSVHVTFFERAAKYSSITKQKNEVQLFDEYLDTQCDKSVYSKKRLMRFGFSVKNTGSEIIKTGIPVTKQTMKYYIYSLIQPVYEVKILSNFSEVFKDCVKTVTKKKVKNETKNASDSSVQIDSNDETEKKHLTVEEKLTLNIKEIIERLLHECCAFAGHEVILNEQSLYVPHNEDKTYGTTFFKDAYIEGFNNVYHKTKVENFDKMPNHFGVLHCLANLVNKCIDSVNKEDLTEDARKEKIKNIYKDGSTVMKYYITRYNLYKNDSSINKFEYKYNEVNTKKTKLASKLYRYYYLHKVAFSYSGKIILKNDSNQIIIKDETDRNLRTIIRRFINRSKLVEDDLKSLRVIKSINGEKLECPDNMNLNLYNLSWLEDPYSGGYSVNDFIKFKTLLYNDTYKNKLSGQFSYKMLVHDIKNKFSRKSHLGFVRFLFGNGATFKTSEYVLYQNIINNLDYTMSTDIANYMKQQKKKILSSLVLLIDEVPMCGKDFMNFIDMVKTNCMNSVIGVRGMGEEESQQVINCRHILCTNHDNIARLLISDRAEINRRFLIAEKVNNLCQDDNDWLGEHVHDPEFCKDFAKWIYQNEEDPNLKTSSLNEYNKSNNEITEKSQDAKDLVFSSLPVCQRVFRYKSKNEYTYMVDVKAWHDKYCFNIAQNTTITVNNIEFEKIMDSFVEKSRRVYESNDKNAKCYYNRKTLKQEFINDYEKMIEDRGDFIYPYTQEVEQKQEQVSEPEPITLHE